MSTQTLNVRLLLAVLMLVQVGSMAHAQDREPALAWSADDAQLQWGPCPPFLPEGCGIAVLHGDPAKDNLDVFDLQRAEDDGAQVGELRVRSRQGSPQGDLRQHGPLRPFYCL